MVKTIAYKGSLPNSVGTFNLRASAAVLIVYKEQFGIEYTEDFRNALKSPLGAIKAGYRLIWAMAKCADDSISDPDAFREMLGDDFDILGAVDSAAELMRKSLGEFVSDGGEPSEDDSEKQENISESLVNSALRCGFSVADLNHISVGFLLRCLSERLENKQAESTDNVKIADENDIAHFLDFFGG